MQNSLQSLLWKSVACFSAAGLIALFSSAAPAADVGGPEALPPPPELVADVGYEIGFEKPAQPLTAEAKQALAPPEVITPHATTAAVQQPVAAPAPQPSRYTSQSVTSQPVVVYANTNYNPESMPEDIIPGVVLPELDDDPSPTPARRGGRLVERGMTIRQLEPYFALAKGSEGEAIDAVTRGDEVAYRDQLTKAVDAYMRIIEMADAGNEAREEAWYGVARCEYRRGNWWKAFDALERSFPGKFAREEVAGRVKLEMFIGERLWRMGDEPVPGTETDDGRLTGYQASSRVYAAAIFNQPAAEDAPLALLRRGDAAAHDREWKEASKFYRQVVEYYPESDAAMQARSSLTEAIYRQDWPGGFPELARTDVATIMDDVERAGGRLSSDAEERRTKAVALANTHEADTKLRHAKEYLKSVRVKKSRDGAVFLLGDVISFYPGTPQAAEAADILRGMGIEPPMVLSDGNRFPLSNDWRNTGAGGPGASSIGGSVQLGGQDTVIPDVSLPPSPTRETVYQGQPFP